MRCMALKKMLKTTGCLKRNTLSRYAAFHWQLSRQLAEKAIYPQTQFRKKAIQRVHFLGHPVHGLSLQYLQQEICT